MAKQPKPKGAPVAVREATRSVTVKNGSKQHRYVAVLDNFMRTVWTSPPCSDRSAALARIPSERMVTGQRIATWRLLDNGKLDQPEWERLPS